MSAISDLTGIGTAVVGVSTFLSHTPLDVLPDWGGGTKAGLFAIGAGMTFAFRILE